LQAIQNDGAPCRGCGTWLSLCKGFPPYAPPSIHKKRGLHVYCSACNYGSYVSIDGQALFEPIGRNFWREEKRILTLPEKEIEMDGVPALHIPFESVRSRAALDMILHRDTYQLLAIHSNASE